MNSRLETATKKKLQKYKDLLTNKGDLKWANCEYSRTVEYLRVCVAKKCTSIKDTTSTSPI